MAAVLDSSSSHSTLPWIWTIEYLASSDHVDLPFLRDLMEIAPQLPDDLAKNTWEMIALRNLEGMFNSINGEFSSMEKKVEFFLSELGEEDVFPDVVQETLQMMAGLKLSGSDVNPFTVRRRALMPECALQRLKDTILDGTHPLAASLTELISLNKCGRTCIDDASTSRLDGSGTDAQTMAENGNGLSQDNSPTHHLAASLKEPSRLMSINECGRTHIDDTLTDRLDGSGTDAQTMAAKRSLIPSTSENRNGLPQDNSPDRNLLPSKRDGNDLSTEDMAGHSNAKKHKQDTTYTDPSVVQSSVLLQGTLDDFSQGKSCKLASECHDEVMEERPRSHGNGHDELVDSKRLDQNGAVNDDENQHNQVMVGHTADKRPNDRSEGKRSSDDDDVITDIAMKKKHFLATTGFRDQNLCRMCGKDDGQLLVCKASSCSVVLHENCLGSAVKFDESGNFYCPFCAYSLAVSKYKEGKKQAFLAYKDVDAFFSN